MWSNTFLYWQVSSKTDKNVSQILWIIFFKWLNINEWQQTPENANQKAWYFPTSLFIGTHTVIFPTVCMFVQEFMHEFFVCMSVCMLCECACVSTLCLAASVCLSWLFAAPTALCHTQGVDTHTHTHTLHLHSICTRLSDRSEGQWQSLIGTKKKRKSENEVNFVDRDN